jgi:hypothetical protein
MQEKEETPAAVTALVLAVNSYSVPVAGVKFLRYERDGHGFVIK